MVLQGVSGMGTGIIIAFIYSWKMALASSVFVPFIMFGGILTARLRSSASSNKKSDIEESGMVQ